MKITRYALILACAALPLVAQTTTTTTTTTKTKTTTRRASSSKTAVWNYSTRLAALLADSQSKATISPESWKAIANEANALANKLYTSTSGKARLLARDARSHVREMHAAAMKGDAEGAKAHAAMALPFVHQLVEWSSPK